MEINRAVLIEEGLKCETVKKAKDFGLICDVSGGIQIDINTARQTRLDGEFVDASLCDHNCRTRTNGKVTGNYDCPAARTLHSGLSVKTLAPAGEIVNGIRTAAEGIRLFNRQIIEEELLEKYYQEFDVPPAIQSIIEGMLTDKTVEVNVFGGNPELHPEVLGVIESLCRDDLVVNLTTTGGRFMRDENFINTFLEHPPDVLALGADDFGDPESIDALANLSLDKIQDKWKRTPFVCGQRRKALEAVYTLRLSEQYDEFPRILSNLVVHEGNIDFVEDIIDGLRRNFPKSTVNSFPAQSSFSHEKPVFSARHLGALQNFVDRRIEEHYSQIDNVVPRLHYYLMLKAAFENSQENPEVVLGGMSGYNIWKCYETSGAGRYLQIGASSQVYSGEKSVAGGHLACFWNSGTTTLHDRQVWSMEPAEIAGYLANGMSEISRNIETPCPGCIMPRLNFDMLSLEMGMSKKLVPAYLDLRKQHVGF